MFSLAKKGGFQEKFSEFPSLLNNSEALRGLQIYTCLDYGTAIERPKRHSTSTAFNREKKYLPWQTANQLSRARNYPLYKTVFCIPRRDPCSS